MRALLSDIEGMYRGAETSDEYRHSEEFFGPFSVGKLGVHGFAGLGPEADAWGPPARAE
ncbi:MAG TPA: hypothetical protein VHU23_11380 [Rhizomicrobium sp.]|nr:hypothetical protein [Rhizomicrobium sp.]